MDKNSYEFYSIIPLGQISKYVSHMYYRVNMICKII